VQEHALGRAIQRTGQTPQAVVFDAHHSVLRTRTALVLPEQNLDRAPQFLLHAGQGAFVCSVRHGRDISLGREQSIHVRAHTWIDADQLHDDQRVFADDGEPGGRLGDTWLLPAPLRRLIPYEGKLHAMAWLPGMPETLAVPRGRA
jgi:hypothetical protein